jgi:Plant transposon protein
MSLYAANIAEAMRHSVMAKSMGFDAFKSGLEILYDSSSDEDGDDVESNNGDSNISSCNSSVDAELTPQVKRPRIYQERLLKTESNWWKKYLSPEKKLLFDNEPLGRDATQFRRMFRVPYRIFEDHLMRLAKSKWSTWRPDKVDSYSKPVADLELKLLGAMFTLGTAATHFAVSTNTNLSDELHRKFFNQWIVHMSSLKDDFIYLPRDLEEYNHVVGEYADMGLPGCVGSVDCVHIGWDMCPTQQQNMYKGKEGYPSVAYEVICTSRKFIQSVSVGHPGSRNDKHIVRTDEAVMSLLYGNGWLQSQSWDCIVDSTGKRKAFFGVYLISDGGYHRWPCFIYPIKSGAPGSPAMKCAAMIESVRKDIEGVFGILKKRFAFLKVFNRMHTQKQIDCAFVTCCIIHNILLKEDGFLEPDLPDFPNGVRARLRHRSGGDGRGDGMWTRGGLDNTPEEDGFEDNQRQTRMREYGVSEVNRLAKMWKQRTDAITNHYQYRKKF